MESNKDEAARCLAIAKKHRDAANFPSAQKFCQKSIALFSTPEATKLLSIIESELSSSSSNPPNQQTQGAASGAEAHASSSGARQRGASTPNSNPGGEEKKRDYTPEQIAVVKRVRGCKITEYYEILAVKKDCEEAEIKKAYRKVRLKVSILFML
jgi:DnaJ family protein B protein 12